MERARRRSRNRRRRRKRRGEELLISRLCGLWTRELPQPAAAAAVVPWAAESAERGAGTFCFNLPPTSLLLRRRSESDLNEPQG